MYKHFNSLSRTPLFKGTVITNTSRNFANVKETITAIGHIK